ncbi:MAG: MBOAT family protein [Clostridia bacterium]|nr:MBOAT family protein [Clostridia bacterium]
MIFNSLSFLMFFPIVTLAYFTLPRRVRPAWLLAASYYFYMCWNARYAMLIAGSTLITYGCGLLIERADARLIKRLIMAAGLGSNLAILGFFKYYGFFTDVLGRVLALAGISLHVPAFDVLLPVGISFYTFQALGYMLDVYFGKIRAERSLLRYALFVSFFPQLVAGPIERSENLLRQVNEEHRFSFRAARDGVLIMMLGFFEKLVIADRASMYVNAVYDNWHAAAGWQILLATVVFAFQIYGDFSGYSHIAIGAAKILGFDLMDNFRQPYFASSVRDFWRRWHISLSTWFRDYLYIPLGGSRCGHVRRMTNLMITFLVSGLWHGASLSFVVWGGLNGALQVLEGLLPKPAKKAGGVRRVCKTLCTFVLIDLTWLFFRANAASTAVRMLLRCVKSFDAAAYATGFSAAQAAALTVGIAVLLAIDMIHERGKTLTAWLDRRNLVMRGALMLLAILAIVVFGVWGPGYDAQAFIYFQF